MKTIGVVFPLPKPEAEPAPTMQGTPDAGAPAPEEKPKKKPSKKTKK